MLQTVTQPPATSPTPNPVTNAHGVLVTEQAVDGVTGTLAFWRLDGEVALHKLAQARDAAGLDYALPKPPTIKRALKRALEAVARGRDTLVERHPKGGYAIVYRGETENRDLDYQQGARVWWSGTEDAGHLEFERAGYGLRTAVVNRFAHYRQTLTGEDISRWLPGLLASMSAVALRAGGGFYFVPADHVATWQAWADLFTAETSHKLYADLPAMRTEGMLDALFDSIIDEAKSTIKNNKRGLDDAGPRALRTRERNLEALAEKLTTYESILGRKLPELHAQTEAARQNVSAALLTEDEE